MQICVEADELLLLLGGGPYGDKTNPSYKVEISNSDVKCALVCELKANKSFGVFVLVENISVHHRKTDIFKEVSFS